jgi:PBSX family phage terminase large subunit
MIAEARSRKVEISFEPVNKSQDDFVKSKASRLLYSGAFGAGKTLALCTKGLKLSLDYPGNFGLICRKTRATMPQTTIKSFFELVCPKELVADYNKSEGLLTLTNKSQIFFAGLDDPLKLGSLNLGWAGVDEAIETTEDDWKMIEGRLRLINVPHQIFAATNPGPPAHYLYSMFFRDKRGDAFSASSFDNTALPEDYKARLSEFTGTYYQRYVLGQWAGLEGLIYSSFDDKTCLIPRFSIDKSWPVYVGHDFGMSNPGALFYAQNPGVGDFYLFAEYLPGAGRSIYDHVQEFKRITEGYNVLKRAGGNHTTEGEIRQGYTQQGWPIQEPKYSQTPTYQIQKVQGLHRLNKIYVFNDLPNYLREKFSFAYKKDNGIMTDRIDNESNYHLMSAERGILSDFTPETVTNQNKYAPSYSVRR